MDGLYYYFINLNNGQMTNPKPIPREDSDVEDSYEIIAKRMENPPRRPRKDKPRGSCLESTPPPQPTAAPYRNKSPRNLRIPVPPRKPRLGDVSTQHLKNSKSSSEGFPPSPRSHYGYAYPYNNPDLRKTVFKGSSVEPASLPRPPIGVYNNRNTCSTFADKKVAVPVLNSTSTNESKTSKSSSELFPPSPKSHYGFAPALKRDNIRAHQCGFVNERAVGNYLPPFVNTVTDVEDKERRSKDLASLKERNEVGGKIEDIVIPIRRGRARVVRQGDTSEEERAERRKVTWLGEVD